MRSVLATSINETHLGKSFETLAGAHFGVLSGVKVLLEFEDGDAVQLELETRVKVAHNEAHPAQWSLSPYAPPKTTAEAAYVLAAIPAQIAVEQETVCQQLAEGKRLVVNAIAGAETVVHEATCNAIEYQVNRELAWGEVRAELTSALRSAHWRTRSFDGVPARMPRMAGVGELDRLDEYRGCRRCRPCPEA